MDRRLFLHIQGGRNVSGVLRGFDMFLNLVVDQAYEELGAGQRKPCGMIVSLLLGLEYLAMGSALV
jgi:small nuclear ribonucleoprotein G